MFFGLKKSFRQAIRLGSQWSWQCLEVQRTHVLSTTPYSFTPLLLTPPACSQLLEHARQRDFCYFVTLLLCLKKLLLLCYSVTVSQKNNLLLCYFVTVSQINNLLLLLLCYCVSKNFCYCVSKKPYLTRTSSKQLHSLQGLPPHLPKSPETPLYKGGQRREVST